MTESETTQILALLTGAYPRQGVGRATLAAYTAMLADLDGVLARRAVTELIATSKWFPTVAEIRIRSAELETGIPSLDEAWSEVIAGISDHGSSFIPKWSHHSIAETVAAIGWYNICRNDKWPAFRDLYATRTGREIREANVRPLLEARGLLELGDGK